MTGPGRVLPMVQEFDIDALMPREEALADMHAAVAEHNAMRPRIHQELLLRSLFVAGGYVMLALFVIVMLLAFGSATVALIALAVMAAAGYFGWRQLEVPTGPFEQRLRERLLPRIFGFVGEVRYQHGKEPAFVGDMPGETFLARNASRYDDTITGETDGLKFALAEAEFTSGSGADKKVVFKGVVLHFERETAFPGLLLAAKRADPAGVAFSETGALTKVRGRRRAIDSRYEFLTDNPEAAGAMVQGALPKAMDFLCDIWPEGEPRLALRRNEGFLLVPVSKDFFETPPLDTAVDFDRDIQPMILDFVTLLATARLVGNIG